MADVNVKQGKLKKTHNRSPDFFIGCPLTHNRSSWCNQFCVPVKGRGPCGRIAAHALRGRTQRAIDSYKRQHPESCCE